jgi:hypothetical protein
VPFYISLRHFAETDLPQQLEQLVNVTAPMLSGGEPDHWVRGLFESGRAMFLVDGLDELVADRRDYAKRWLETFVRTYPEARYVVSTRPSAVDDGWFVDAPGRTGLVRFELLPLSNRGLERVINCWYAAAVNQETDPVQQAWLTECQTSLWEGLATRPNLRTLVASPLLTALLCALYRQNNKYLPRTRRELLDQALDLLLEKWDDAKPRFNDAQHGVAVEDELRMTKRAQLILLERFAAPMVQGSELLVSRDDATRRLKRAMEGLRSEGLDSGKLLQHMLVRTGLLRDSPVDQKIEFVHRTFRDYLAAADMVKAGEIQTLVENAHKDSWYEVVFMAAAQAREREVAKLLRGLLTHAIHSHDQDKANRLTLVAAACLGYADVVDPDRARIEVQNAARRLIPPASFHDAEMLAKAGPFVIDLLPGPDELRNGPDQDATAARVIRTLAMIGREEAWEKIQPFTTMHHSTVVDELLRGWRQFDFSEEYAQTLLSHVEFGDRVLDERRWELLPRLRHLTTLRTLKLIGDLPLADPRANQHPLADIANLRRLDIVANETIRDLRTLTRCRNLRILRILGPSRLVDLSALASSTVDQLTLRTIVSTVSQAEVDLHTLAGARLRFLSIKHSKLSGGLHPLPGDLPLVELEIVNRAESRSLLGIEQWKTLEKVTATGVPTMEEIHALSQLPALRHLVLRSPDPVDDLVRLRPLVPSIKILELDEVPEQDVQAATNAIGDNPGMTLQIHIRKIDAPTEATRQSKRAAWARRPWPG